MSTTFRYYWGIFAISFLVSLLGSSVGLWGVRQAEATQTDIAGPPGSGTFGATVTVLPNGNFVVTDPTYTEGGLTSIGAVYLYHGTTLSMLSVLKGSTAEDQVGSGGVTVLSNGHYVVSSPNWDELTASIVDVGAVTYCDGNTGCTGLVSASNSLIGSTASDNVGSGGLTALSNGNYVVSSANWDHPALLTPNVGAVTWCSGSSGCTGVVSVANSLIGSTASDNVGFGSVTALSNGNYLVKSVLWDNPVGPIVDAGAITVGNGTTGTVGVLTADNSVLGTVPNEFGTSSANVAYDLTRRRLVVGRSPSNVVTLFPTITEVCGNSTVEGQESCDDGNTTNGDGCTSACTIESGYSCSGTPSVCTLLCGNGSINAGEQCDMGSSFNGQADVCCSATCTFKPATAVCRSAAGVCDLAESCTGSSALCPADTKSTVVCRSSAGVCDVAESCTGSSNTCPNDGFAPSSLGCRASTGLTDPTESCTGTGPTCPPDVNAPPDTIAPNTSISTGPSGTIAVNSAMFTWTGTDNVTAPANLQYAYRLDPIETTFSAFGSTTSKTYSALPNGSYTFLVKARDQAGIEDSTPASQAFAVNVVSGPMFTATPASLILGGPVIVNWSGVTNPSGRDWIGLYRQGALNTAYSNWLYVNCTQTIGLTRAAGSCTFPISSVGAYEFRYFRNNGLTTLVTSNIVTVGTTVTLPTVTVQATAPTATEGGTAGQFTVSRTGSTTAALTVAYAMSGTAASGADYTALTGSVTIPAGATSAPIAVTPMDDSAAENNETVIVTLTTNAAYTVGTSNSATVTIADNDSSGSVVLTATPSIVGVGQTVTVNWNGVTNANGSDRLGVYVPGASNASFVDWKYVSCSRTAGTARAAGSCPFIFTQAGIFEVRYLRSDGVTSLATVTVQVSTTSVPSGFSPSIYVNALASPTAMAFAPDGRLFVAEQNGALRVVTATGTLLGTPFVNLSSKISGGSERGLLGVAFDPNFTTNPYVYVYYTASTPSPHNRVSRFIASSNVASLSSEEVVFDLDNLSGATNHNGGALHFGADGKLYVASGDNANSAAAQALSTTFGKLLRLNPSPVSPIPTDNPFLAQTSDRNQAIYALGFRNPFTFSVHPASGRIFVNDVGQAEAEEINDLLSGQNYGWPLCEGSCSTSGFVNPVYAYTHAQGCAITGGVFDDPRVAQLPALYEGNYFFADLCSGWIRRLDLANGNTVGDFAVGYGSIVDLDFGPDGALYVLDATRNNSVVHRIVYQPTNQPPILTLQPANQSVGVGQPATFTVSAFGTAPLSYQWQKNGSDIPGATTAVYTMPSTILADNGAVFRCRVTNALGSVTSNPVTLTVTGQAPTAFIVTPTAGELYTAGQPVSFSGTASDPEDGTLPPSAFTWDVDFYHDDAGEHAHPADPPVSGITNGSFTPSATEETSANVWYRITLTVRDSHNLTFTTFRDMLPRKATISLATNVPGVQLTLDGVPVATPHVVLGVVGHERTIGAPLTQIVNGQTYVFTGWSDGGTATHTITTPETDTTYTATYQLQ